MTPIPFQKSSLDSINEEYQKCISQKEAAIVLLKDFSKKMTAQIEDIKFPELDKYLSQKYAYVKSSFSLAIYVTILMLPVNKVYPLINVGVLRSKSRRFQRRI